jgi:hypothetical protein
LPPDHPPLPTSRLMRTRVFYPSPLMTAPSVMVIDLPVPYRGEGLALGRYYPIIIETDSERDKLEAAFEQEREGAWPPDLFDQRPSSIWTDRILISRHRPPVPDWPWLCVTHWPNRLSDRAVDRSGPTVRGCYRIEFFETAIALDAHCAILLGGLEAEYPGQVRMLSAGMPTCIGAA